MSGFEGLANVQANLAKAIREIQGRTMKGVIKAAMIVGRDAKIRTPIDKGILRGSQTVTWDNVEQEPTAAVAYGASYAPFVHENLEAHHEKGEAKFLERAVDAKSSEVLETIRQEAKVP